MAIIIDGKAIAEGILARIKLETGAIPAKPKLVIVTYSPDERSKQYVKLKLAKAEEIGIDVDLYDWSGLDYEVCAEKMKELAASSAVTAIIMQLPANGLTNTQEILNLIPADKDVDGLSDTSLELLRQGKQKLIPATPRAILSIIEASSIELQNKKILIIGQGKLVGLPLAIILQNKGLQVQTADKETENLSELTRRADLIVSAAGSAGLLNGAMIKDGAIVLDAGAAEADGKIIGDVDYGSVESKASIISKVPGGIGPVTVACLLENVLKTTKNPQ